MQKTALSFDIPAGIVREGEIKFAPRETPDERRHRLRQEVWSFWVKEASTYVVALFVLVLTAAYCFWVLFWHPNIPL